MKRIVFFSAITIALMVIFSLLGSIYQLWHKQDVLYITAKQLAKVKKEHQDLTKQLKVVGTQQFVEQQARDDLFLTKQDEHEVIIAGNLMDHKEKTIKNVKEVPYWQQWIDLFF